ncbi:DUF6531 domain-containing protein [Amycolatopsis sp. NBC_00348]|uniref:LamG-like jellyroll fold domain-containing protein n=1 Tax=Amycolatopsis sp. NBC_00348 TaxID=2975956 RepID=UPI002E27275E
MILLPVAGSAVEYAKPGAPLPAGASLDSPAQRAGTGAGVGDDGNPALSPRDTPRPPGAVADERAVPPAQTAAMAARQHVKPAVVQRNDRPSIDPKAVERPQDRTENTETFDNPDGTRTLRVHSGPSNVRRPDGSWQPADLNLVAGADGRLRPKTSAADVSFATSAAADPVATFGVDGLSLGYALRDAAPAAGQVHGDAVTYPAVRPDTDLRLTATAGGLEEELVLHSARAQTRYSFTLHTGGLQPRLAGRAVELTDAAGAIRATVPAGFMTDAKIDPATGQGVRSDGVGYGLSQVDARTWTLQVDVDPAWLHDSARVFPVVVDPTLGKFSSDTDDTYVRSGTTANHSTEDLLEVGSPNGGATISRSYLHFTDALNRLRNQYILGATVNVLATYSCQARPATLFEATQGWGRETTWPGAAAGRALATTQIPALTGSSCSGQYWAGFQLPQEVPAQWSHGQTLGNGFTLRATNEGDSAAFKRFASADTVNQPYIDVSYSPEGATYELTDVLLPTNNREGTFTARVTNMGSSTWPAGGGYRLGYVVKQGGTVVKTSQGVAPAAAVPPGAQTTITVPLTALTPGAYDLNLTMWTPANQDFNAVYGVPYGQAPLKVENVPPGSNYQQPGNGGIVESLTPTLFARAVDDDGWPNKGFKFLFRICTDVALTQNCTESGWGPESWTPPPGTLAWSKTYYWGIKTHDTVSPSPDWAAKLALTTRVPQPEITSHLAGSPDTVNGPGLDPQIGNYSTVVTDASVATVGPDLTITRTYNSLDPRRDTAFGVGWASRLDTRLVPNRSAQNVVTDVLLTYPNGRQARFGRNPDGTFAPPMGQNVDLVYDSGTGYYTLRDVSGTRWLFDNAGKLITITDPAGLTETLTHDANGRVDGIVNDVSHRKLTVTWTGAHVTQVQTPAPKTGDAPLSWTYTYVGDALTSVCAPGPAPNCTNYGRAMGSHYRSSVLDDGPRGYWRLDEESGASAANVAARTPGADAAPQNGLGFGAGGALAGTGDTAAVFDGMASYLKLPDDLLSQNMSASAELWFKTSASGTLLGYADEAFPGTSSSKARPVLYVGVDGSLYGGFTARNVTGPSQVVSAAKVNDNTWHHAVLTSEVNTQTLYLDGAAVGTIAGIVDHGSLGKLSVGGGVGKNYPSTNGGDFYFAGAIDEVALYQHTLSPFAVKQHFDAAQAVDELTGITLPQDSRSFAKLTYDDRADRVKTLTDHDGRNWTLDAPVRVNADRTVTLHGPYPDWTYKFDADQGGRLTSTLHSGFSKSWEYNEKGFVRATVDEAGGRVEQTTDDRGNVLSRKTCRAVDSCNTAYFTYISGTSPLDPRADKPATSSDARSSSATDTRYRTSYAYDTAGRLTTTTFPIPAGQTVAPTEVSVYAQGNEAAADNNGKVPAGVLLQVTDRRGQVARNSYLANGDLYSGTDVKGLVTTFAYDGIGRKTSQRLGNAGGANYGTTSFEYTPQSRIAKVTAPGVVNPVTGVTHTPVTANTYDGDGNLLQIEVTDATGGDVARKSVFSYDKFDHQVGVSYPDGGVVTYEYSADLLKLVTTDVLGVKWTDQYDDQHRLLSRVADGIGADPSKPGQPGILRVENRSYDSAGRLERVQDAMDRSTRYSYYGDGLLWKATLENYRPPTGPARDVVLDERTYDPAGNVSLDVTAGGRKTASSYDAAGYVSESTVDPDALKRKATFVRDGAGNVTRMSATGAADPSRVETTDYTYAPDGQVSREDTTAASGLILSSTTTYDERGLAIKTSDRRQVETQYTYDATGQQVSVINPAVDVWVNGVQTTGVTTSSVLGRNTFGEVTQSKDASGNVTTTERDSMGRATSGTLPAYTPPGTTTPIVPTTRTEYDYAGNALTVTDPLNHVTASTYDPYGNVLTTTLPQVGDTPSVAKNSYDGNGELTSTTDPAGARQEFTYDDFGRQVTSTQVERYDGQPVYYTAKTGYDDAGNVTSTTSPQNFVSTAAYNGADEPVSSTDATNRTVTYGYDNAGREASTTDATGLTSTNTYDLAGRMTGSAQVFGGQQQRASTVDYDGNGNVLHTKSPEGRTVDYGYDFLNRLVKQVEKVDSAKSITTWTGYDRLGNRSHFIDGNGHATDYTYTPWGMPDSVVEPSVAGATAPADRTWTTSYDAAGRAAKLTAPGGVTRTRDYDEQDRLAAEHGAGAENATADRTYGYDSAGRLAKIGSPGGDTNYRYDDRGNLRTSQGASGTAVYTYNGDGTLATRSDAAGNTAFTYDGAGRLSSAADPLTGRTTDYKYDAVGRLSVTQDRAVAGRIMRTSGYDNLGRLSSDSLTQLTDVGSRVLLGDTYGYDNDDKVTTKTSTRSVGATTANSYGYDGAGRLTSWTAGSQTTTYGWDDAGNRTSVNGSAYTYNERNQLLSGGGATYAYRKRGTLQSVTRGSVTTTNGFDAFDRLVREGTTTNQYDSNDRLVNRNGTALTYDGLSNETVTDGTRKVSRLPDGTALGDKGAAGGKTLFADRHGDVEGRYLGAVVDGQRTYDPFGTVTSSSGETSNLGYQGDWTTPDTGLVNMTARWYDPNRGGFVSRDDWNLSPDPSAATNRYTYGNGDAVGNTDPSGHNPVCSIIGGAAGGWFFGIFGDIVGDLFGAGACPGSMSDGRDCIKDRCSAICYNCGHYDATDSAWHHQEVRGSNGSSRGPSVVGPRLGGRPGGRPSGGTSTHRPVRPSPPPPPPWLVNAIRPAHQLPPGATVADLVDATNATTPATTVEDPTGDYYEDANETTEAPQEQGSPGTGRPPVADNADFQTFCDSLDMEPNKPEYLPMEPAELGDGTKGMRATGGSVCLTETRNRTGRPTKPFGWERGMHRGHIIASIFWGSNGQENIVPQFELVNIRDMLHSIETGTRDAVGNNTSSGRQSGAPQSVFYMVRVLYKGSDPVPWRIDAAAYGSGGFECYVQIYNVKEGNDPRTTC